MTFHECLIESDFSLIVSLYLFLKLQLLASELGSLDTGLIDAVSISDDTDLTDSSRSVTSEDLNTGKARICAGWNLKLSASCIPVLRSAS